MPSAAATSVVQEPTSLSARAAVRLAGGPLDPVTLMREVCKIDRLQPEAADRMAAALLGPRSEFVRLSSGHWALRETSPAYQVGSAVQINMFGEDDAPASAASDVPRPGLRELSFAVVDVETTGARAGRGDRITEISIVRVQHGGITDVLTHLVNPQRSIPPSIVALTQITWAMVRDQPCFHVIAPDVTARLQGSIFTAHNAGFDWRFVNEELSRSAGQRLQGPRLCTVRFARAMLPQLSRRSLDHVTNHFGISISARHRAEGDAVATAEVLVRLLRIAEDQGIGCWDDLEALVMRTGRGRRRGRTARDRRRRALPMPVTDDRVA